ncbi:MAG: UDP-N-acetylmuramoyl-L-alanine--D-glutamate ligase [Verrucomicrobiota bacterium]
MNLKNKNTLVLGLGKSGLAAVMLLLAQGARVSVYDVSEDSKLQRTAEELRQKGVNVHLGDFALRPESYELCVLSPGLDPRKPIVQNFYSANVKIISEIELASWFASTQIIAVTGTNGKSTTTELIASALSAAGKKVIACGNLGLPFSEVVLKKSELDAVVLEVSSFQLEAIDSFRPNVAVHLNLSPDHLDRYDSFEHYRRTKLRIFENQEANDLAIVNANLELTQIKASQVTFSSDSLKSHFSYKNQALFIGEKLFLRQNETKLLGPHNAENQLAAIAVTQNYEIDESIIKNALIEYSPLAHRCQIVEVIEGVRYIDDSKATNVDAMKKAILAQQGEVILIAGGKDKGVGFKSLIHVVEQRVKKAVLIGQTKHKIRTDWGDKVTCVLVDTLEKAVEEASMTAVRGDVVLLSPGCSSFDMFEGFEDRGKQFANLVRKMT